MQDAAEIVAEFSQNSLTFSRQYDTIMVQGRCAREKSADAVSETLFGVYIEPAVTG